MHPTFTAARTRRSRPPAISPRQLRVSCSSPWRSRWIVRGTEMRRLHRIAMALWIAAATSCGSTGGALVTLPFRAGGQQAGGPLTFTSQSGWTVTMRKAKISLGPFYFNNVPASTETFRNGLVVIQVTRQVVVDAIDPSLHDVLGGADGETGHAVAVEIGLFPPDTTQPSSTRSELGGNFGLVAGTATKGSTTVAFSGPIAIDTSVLTPQNAALLQRVRGAAVDLDLSASAAISYERSRAAWSKIWEAMISSSAPVRAVKSLSQRFTVAGEPTAEQASTWSRIARSPAPHRRADGGGRRPGLPLRRLTIACSSDVASRAASWSLSAAITFTPNITYGRASCAEGRNWARYSSIACISSAGAKCEANAYGRPSTAARRAPYKLDPRIQIGTSRPAPGTARTG